MNIYIKVFIGYNLSIVMNTKVYPYPDSKSFSKYICIIFTESESKTVVTCAWKMQVKKNLSTATKMINV